MFFLIIIIKTHKKKQKQGRRRFFVHIIPSHNSNKYKKAQKNRGVEQPKNCVRSERERRTFKEQTVDAFYKLTEKAKIFMNEKLNVRKSCACAFMNFESFQSTRENKKCFNIISLTHEHIQVRRSIALTRSRSFLTLAEEIQCQYLHIKRRKGDKTHIHVYI